MFILKKPTWLFAVRIGWRDCDPILRWLHQQANRRQEKENRKQKMEIPEIQKSGENRKWKVEKYRFPMWFVMVGPCSFWFLASSYECLLGVDLGVNLGVDRDITNKKRESDE